MITLFRNGHIFTPEDLGQKDLLVAGGKVAGIGESISPPQGVPFEIVEAEQLKIIPGIIDGHIHIAGAGGEGGPTTRTPEVQLSQLLKAGVTSVVGLLGTDGFTRSIESVLMKAKALRAEGLGAWIFTGAYQVPTPTLLGDVSKDIALLDEVIGVGEVAIADHRSSGPTVQEIIRLAHGARVGAMIGKKGGIVNLHLGDGENGFDFISEVVEGSELNFNQFLPTHCNRSEDVFEAAKAYGQKGYLDITASGTAPDDPLSASYAIVQLVEAGVPLEHITMSSDGCGSLPVFDDFGELKGLTSGDPGVVFKELKKLVTEHNWTWDWALKVATSNVADILKLPGKGRIAAGGDADLVCLTAENQIHHVLAGGTFMIKDGQLIRKGQFENTPL